MCLSGAAASLLPALPEGFFPWAMVTALFVIYPLLLRRVFKTNRADYEFRLLHWFPAGILFLWFLLAIFDADVQAAHILFLGFFILWSLPLVILGIFFLLLFSIHVIRRRVVRIVSLSVLLLVFAVAGASSDVTGLNARLSAAMFPSGIHFPLALNDAFRSARFLVNGGPDVVGFGSVDTSSSSAGHRGRSASSVASLPPALRSERKPEHLAKSGPEDFFLIGATLVALYAGVLHFRIKRRDA